jgi:hypothetical protein
MIRRDQRRNGYCIPVRARCEKKGPAFCRSTDFVAQCVPGRTDLAGWDCRKHMIENNQLSAIRLIGFAHFLMPNGMMVRRKVALGGLNKQ